LNRCVRFQSAKKPPTAVNAATEVRILRPELVRFMCLCRLSVAVVLRTSCATGFTVARP
jgi:hypothetical protein